MRIVFGSVGTDFSVYILHQLFGFLYLAVCAAMVLASNFAVIKGRIRIFLIATGIGIMLFLLWFGTLEYLLWAGAYPGATGMEGLGVVIMGLAFFAAILVSIVIAGFTALIRTKT
jgi:hypothetical protein